MKTFTDSAGRTWTITITVDAIKRVQGLVGVNLADLTTPGSSDSAPLLTRLETDIVLLCDVIYALVKPQCEQQQVTDEQFGQALGGDAITAAHDAFWEELRGFFLQLRRGDQARAIQKQIDLVKAAVNAVDRRIEDLDVDQVVGAAFQTDSNSPTNSPASAAFPPEV